MAPSSHQIRHWIQGFEAIAQADRERLRQQGPRPEWSIPVALSLIEAARAAGSGTRVLDPGREAADEAVRKVWERLRVRLRK